SGVKASASQSGNPASGATDNNPNSRWSNQGFGSWIQLDLGSVKKICSADISWYRGNERQYTFDISSSQDGNIFTKIFSGINTVTNAPEKYTFSETQARYLKITVTGNTQNDWASISEVDIFGTLDSPTPTPTPTPTPGPVSDDVQEIYPTAAGGETWFFNPNNPVDGQFDSNGAEISKNSDGSWHLKPGTTRMNVYTKSAGLLSDNQRSNLATYDYSALAQKGYWYQPTDWKNVEATGYFKVSSSSSGDGISFVTRSVRHSNAIENGCGGSAYHNNIRFDGTFQYKKEMWHVNYDILSPTKNGIGSILNKWVGFKGVVYNLPDGTVKLESYVDKDNNNHWQKVEELIDSGHWGNDMTHCNANTPGAAITWASPMFDYKSTGVTYDFQKLSLREIYPPHQ
ncbi:MAG: discoidin domain-containing protein, partial [Nitrososphaeraceae archaeon]